MPTNEEWTKRWVDEDTPWDHERADSALHAEYAQLLSEYPQLEGATIFVPLCGNSSSLRFFYDRGHPVTGLEVAPQALAELRQRDFPEISFVERNVASGTEFRADRVVLLQGDFFSMSLPTDTALVYDRAALVAIEASQRAEYARVLQQSLVKNGLVYLVTFEYTEGPDARPPFSVPKHEVDSLFAACEITERDRRRMKTKREDILKYSEKPPEQAVYSILKS